jgi:hypothetical protein
MQVWLEKGSSLEPRVSTQLADVKSPSSARDDACLHTQATSDLFLSAHVAAITQRLERGTPQLISPGRSSVVKLCARRQSPAVDAFSEVSGINTWSGDGKAQAVARAVGLNAKSMAR